jgi:hypothetical protein
MSNVPTEDRDPKYAYWDRNLNGSFLFWLRPERTTAGGDSAEITKHELFCGLFEYAHGFLRADEVTVSVKISEDSPQSSDWAFSSPGRTVTRTVSGPNVREAVEREFDSVETADDECKGLTSIEATAAARIWLPGCDEFLSEGHDRYRSGMILLDDPAPASGPPIQISLTSGFMTPDGILRLGIQTKCDVWFKDSKAGAKNRKRLQTLLAYVSRYQVVKAMGPDHIEDIPGRSAKRLDPERYVNAKL